MSAFGAGCSVEGVVPLEEVLRRLPSSRSFCFSSSELAGDDFSSKEVDFSCVKAGVIRGGVDEAFFVWAVDARSDWGDSGW